MTDLSKLKKKVIHVPEHLLMELMKGKNISIINGDSEFLLKPQTEGVFITRAELQQLQYEAGTNTLAMMERLRREGNL